MLGGVLGDARHRCVKELRRFGNRKEQPYVCSLDVRPKEVVRTAMSPDRRQLVVRPVERADRRQWEQLWRGYNDFYERAIPAAVTDVAWSRFFDAYEPMHALVAERDGK